MGALRKFLLLVVVPLVLLSVGVELIGYALLPAPSGTAIFNERFYVYDRDLVVRLRPGLRENFTAIRPDLDATVTTNDQGFRGDPFSPPDPDALRIVVLGDSVSFGLGVDDAAAWPAVMQELLQARSRGRAVQVRNLAVPGYSTFQGRIMYQRYVTDGNFDPQIVVFAFGFNDGFLRATDDEATRVAQRALHEEAGMRARTWLADHSRFLRWLWQRDEPPPATPRCSAAAVRQNLTTVATAARTEGRELLLVDSSLPHSYVRDTVREISAQFSCTPLSFRDAFIAHTGGPREGVWRQGGDLRVVLQTHGVAIPSAGDGRPDLYLIWLDDARDRPRLRRVPLKDHGDGSWSTLVSIGAGQRPEFGVSIPALAAQAPEMSNDLLVLNGVHLQQPGPRPPAADGSAPRLIATANVCPWPELVLLPDPIHASTSGCALMAQAVTEAIVAGKSWKDLVGNR